MNFTEVQLRTIQEALRLARWTYVDDARVSRFVGTPDAAAKFTKLAEQCHQLDMLIENRP